MARKKNSKSKDKAVVYGPQTRQQFEQAAARVLRAAGQPKARPPRRAKSSKVAHGRPNQRSGLSQCAQEYAAAVVDPFDGPLACVPSSFPPIPSWKTRIWQKGTFSTGTNGVGFVVVAPRNFYTSDGGGVSKSTITYAGAGFPGTYSGAGITQANSNAPYPQASIGEAAKLAQFRQVALGIRVWYVGSELSIQGEMVALRQPDNESVLGLTMDETLAFPSSRRVAISSARAPLDVRWTPMKPKELEFQGVVDNNFCLGILATGPNASANIFSYEVYAIGEYIGYNVPNRSPSHADPAGFAAVLTAVQNQGDSWYGDVRDSVGSLISAAWNGLKDLSGSPGGRALINATGRAGMSYLLGPSMAIGPSITEIDLPGAEVPDVIEPSTSQPTTTDRSNQTGRDYTARVEDPHFEHEEIVIKRPVGGWELLPEWARPSPGSSTRNKYEPPKA